MITALACGAFFFAGFLFGIFFCGMISEG